MRRAKFDHAWGNCRTPSKFCLSIKQIDVQHAQGVNEVFFTSNLAALIGPNGAGKTGFLRNLEALLSGYPCSVLRPNISAIHGRFRGQDFSITQDSAHSIELISEFIDVSLDVHNILNYFLNQADFDEFVTQYGFGKVRDPDLGLYKHVCRRNYSEIKIAEIEAPSEPTINTGVDDDRVYPFFIVRIANIEYDSRTMGFGELCAFYVIWRANRAPKGSILLFDEPDSHLSPAARLALLDALAFLAAEHHLWILFTSHAVETLYALQESEMSLIYSESVGADACVIPVATKRNVVRALGLAPLRRLLVVVEDVDAEEVVYQILNRWGNDFANYVDVQIVPGGASEVIKFTNLFPKTSTICRVIAVLDGDKKLEFGNKTNFFLPSDCDPVEAARISANSNYENFAAILNVDAQHLKTSLANISHVNHHDFCSELLGELNLNGVKVSQIRSALMKTWVNTNIVSESAQQLAERLSMQLDSIPFHP